MFDPLVNSELNERPYLINISKVENDSERHLMWTSASKSPTLHTNAYMHKCPHT